MRQSCILSPLLFILFGQDRQRQFSSSGVTFRECNVWRLLFADYLALVSLSKSGLQYTLDRFSDACLDAEMNISTAKTKITCMSRHSVLCFFQINGITLQEKKYKYLRVTFSSDGRQDNKLTVDTRIEKESAVIRQLYRSVVLKR